MNVNSFTIFRQSHDHKKPREFNESTYYRAGEFVHFVLQKEV